MGDVSLVVLLGSQREPWGAGDVRSLDCSRRLLAWPRVPAPHLREGVPPHFTSLTPGYQAFSRISLLSGSNFPKVL